MATIEYSLFRAKLIKRRQMSLFADNSKPANLLLQAINERPSTAVREGYTWHIGNIEAFTAVTGYFAVGRTTSATVEKYDPNTRNFVEEKLETSPYTHVVYNIEIGLLAIAKKNKLAPTAQEIASKIESLLSGTSTVHRNDLIVEIPPIRDPRGFLKEIAAAYRVTRFAATFKGPNPIDADELFQKPLSVYLAPLTAPKARRRSKAPT